MRYKNFKVVQQLTRPDGLRIQLQESDPVPGERRRCFEAELGVVLDTGMLEDGWHPLFGNLIRHYVVENSLPWWPNSTPWEEYDSGI